MKDLKRQLYLLTIQIVVCALVFVGAAYAWLGENGKLTSQGQKMQILDDSGVAVNQFYVYKREGVGDTAKLVSTNTNNVEIEMTEYDVVFTDRNVNTPIIIRANLGNIHNGAPIEVSLKCQGGNWTDTGTVSGTLTKHLSNIIGVRCFYANEALIGHDPLDESVYDRIYGESRSWLEERQPQVYSFAHVTTTGEHSAIVNESKDTMITFTLPNPDSYTFNGEVVVFIELTYNEDLIDAYVQQNGITISADSSVVGGDVDIFPNDISSLHFEQTR